MWHILMFKDKGGFFLSSIFFVRAPSSNPHSTYSYYPIWVVGFSAYASRTGGTKWY